MNGEHHRDAENDAPVADTTLAEGIEIEGLSVPLSSSQRARRGAMAGLAIAAILALLVWPALTSLWNGLPTAQLFVQATATAAGSWRSGIAVSSSAAYENTVVIRVGPPLAGKCPVTPVQSINGWQEMHPDIFGTIRYRRCLGADLIQSAVCGGSGYRHCLAGDGNRRVRGDCSGRERRSGVAKIRARSA